MTSNLGSKFLVTQGNTVSPLLKKTNGILRLHYSRYRRYPLPTVPSLVPNLPCVLSMPACLATPPVTDTCILNNTARTRKPRPSLNHGENPKAHVLPETDAHRCRRVNDVREAPDPKSGRNPLTLTGTVLIAYRIFPVAF